MASRNFRSSNGHGPECLSRQSEYTLDGRSLAEAAGMSRSAFAARFKELLGQTPLEYVTEWRMQKAMQLLKQRDKKLIDVARLVGYESDAALSKRSSELSGPTLVNTSEVVLKATVMPE
jgi:AraC-like DNA-binding protein